MPSVTQSKLKSKAQATPRAKPSSGSSAKAAEAPGPKPPKVNDAKGKPGTKAKAKANGKSPTAAHAAAAATKRGANGSKAATASSKSPPSGKRSGKRSEASSLPLQLPTSQPRVSPALQLPTSQPRVSPALQLPTSQPRDTSPRAAALQNANGHSSALKRANGRASNGAGSSISVNGGTKMLNGKLNGEKARGAGTASHSTASNGAAANGAAPNGAAPNGDRRGRSEIVLPGGYRPMDNEPFMNERQRAYFRGKLLAWKDEIVRLNMETLKGLHDDSTQQADPADRATAETDRALELRARDRQRKLMGKIDAALARIEEGTYGYCEETGEPISLKRLDARPIATLSLEAQERRERRERVFRED